MKSKTIYIFSAMLIATIFAVGVALWIGPTPIPLKSIVIILGKFFSASSDKPLGTDALILLQIRLPRILLAFTVGAGLACVGAIYQGLLGNPLADPYILGSSSGAALGASTAMVLGFFGIWIIPVFAFAGSCLALIIVYVLARSENRLPLQTLLLSGVIVNAFLFALVMFLLSFAGKDSSHILMWLLGSLSSATPSVTAITAVITAAGIIIASFFAWEINIISLGEEKAQQLGVDTEKTKKYLLIVTSLIVGAVVSASGLIGFVGLIVPHMVRILTGHDQRKLIPCSIFAGGIFLIMCDTFARTALQPRELPVGVITALCGAPFFLYLLKSSGKRHG